MFGFSYIRESFQRIKLRMQENSFHGILGIVNVIPTILGFSVRKDRVSAPYFILHIGVLVYIYGVGTVVFQMKYAQSVGEYIKSFVNVSLFVLIASNTYWFIMQRPLLRSLLVEMEASDILSRSNSASCLKHKKMMSRIKMIILLFYLCNYFNEFCVYLPARADIRNSYAMTPCVGMEPLTRTPNKQICIVLLSMQELMITFVVLNYQMLLVFMIAHTALLYQLLTDEIMRLNNFNRNRYFNNPAAKELLPVVIQRHVMIQSIVDKVKALYSVPVGINFGSNAVCMSLFFYLPLQEWLQFMPIVMYCFLVFFLYCFLCQRLTNAAVGFEMAVYACGWENFEVREKKAVYFMLRQAQKPVELLAADIVPVNISTFATTLQAMFKFVTVVKV